MATYGSELVLILIGLVCGISLAYSISPKPIPSPQKAMLNAPESFAIAGTVRNIDYDKNMIMVDAVSPYDRAERAVLWVTLDRQTSIYPTKDGKYVLATDPSDIPLYPGSYVALWIDGRGGPLRAQSISIEPNI